MKTVVIVHGWEGNPEIGWFAWLEEKLKKKGFKVIKPKMPKPSAPEIGAWLKKISAVVKSADEETYFIGHSIGCQAILRFIEKSKFKKIGGIILVAGWLDLTEFTYIETPGMENEMIRIARPWVTTKIDFTKIKTKTKKVTCVFSDNDPYVAFDNAKIFKKRLGAKIIVEHEQGHFGEANTKTIHIVLKEMELISK
jgi:hypothetical protein